MSFHPPFVPPVEGGREKNTGKAQQGMNTPFPLTAGPPLIKGELKYSIRTLFCGVCAQAESFAPFIYSIYAYCVNRLRSLLVIIFFYDIEVSTLALLPFSGGEDGGYGT